ncbi:MAG: hypothetical protein PF488_02880 [Patescibacteria group bacterium]|jgi:hypothetical protein|nr:hypothetical protein [Patescibacteria group bacterium]
MKQQFKLTLILSLSVFILFLGINIVRAESLASELKGRILLQAEQNGEAWYISPDNEKRYYMGRPADAFSLMRGLGLGIKHDLLVQYLNNKFPTRLSGKIMLDVEKNGEAYYVSPVDLKGYYLGRPTDAFDIMKELGLGITFENLLKIQSSESSINNIYKNNDCGYETYLPSDWFVFTDSNPFSMYNPCNINMQSLDYNIDHPKDFETSITKGAQAKISMSDTEMRSLDDIRNFYILGRGGHIQQSEKVVNIAGVQGLLHTLDDYTSGYLQDVHFLYNNKSININFSYSDDKKNDYETIFNSIINSFKFID